MTPLSDAKLKTIRGLYKGDNEKLLEYLLPSPKPHMYWMYGSMVLFVVCIMVLIFGGGIGVSFNRLAFSVGFLSAAGLAVIMYLHYEQGWLLAFIPIVALGVLLFANGYLQQEELADMVKEASSDIVKEAAQ